MRCALSQEYSYGMVRRFDQHVVEALGFRVLLDCSVCVSLVP